MPEEEKLPKEPVEEVEEDEEKATPASKIQKKTSELKEANNAYEAELNRKEKIAIREAKGGMTNAGSQEKSEKDIENDKAKEMLSKTGLDPFAGAGKDALL